VFHGVSKSKLIKFFRASSRVKWLKVDKTDVSKTISVLVRRETADEDGDGPRNVGLSNFNHLTDVSRIISVLVLRESSGKFQFPLSFPEDEDGDGPRNVGFIYF
jgi:hypothetical protein